MGPRVLKPSISLEIEGSFLYSTADLLFPGTGESLGANCARQKHASKSLRHLPRDLNCYRNMQKA